MLRALCRNCIIWMHVDWEFLHRKGCEVKHREAGTLSNKDSGMKVDYFTIICVHYEWTPESGRCVFLPLSPFPSV